MIGCAVILPLTREISSPGPVGDLIAFAAARAEVGCDGDYSGTRREAVGGGGYGLSRIWPGLDGFYNKENYTTGIGIKQIGNRRFITPEASNSKAIINIELCTPLSLLSYKNIIWYRS